ncbi:MAG TPA: hypothetical protein VGV87_08175 [Blastocatellia bacterium]|nr:hypothetical protein [Blastocatellia bacterium]
MKMEQDRLSNTSTAKLSLALLALLMFAIAPGIRAQTERGKTRTATLAEVVISRNEMRFRAPEPVTAMRLEVLNQSGESVFDSGEKNDKTLLWLMQDGEGKPLASGLYAYTLTLKTADAAESRAQRGYLIVDWEADRATRGDRFWLTSHSTVAADAQAGEVVVAGDENATVVGLRTNNPRGGSQDATPNQYSRNAKKAGPEAPVLIAGTGTQGQIAKWISDTDLGDSVITEAGGLIGIGTTTPTSPLTVTGSIDTDAGYRISNRLVLNDLLPGGLFVGTAAGFNNTTGSFLTAVGHSAGVNNTTGNLNTFLGYGAGSGTTVGGLNTFLGANAGDNNSTGNETTFVGYNTRIGTGLSNGTNPITNAAAIGSRAVVSQSNSLVLGSVAGLNGAAATVNVGIGTSAPRSRLDVRSGNIYIGSPGQGLILRSPNTSVCRILTINNFGTLLITPITCIP